MKFLKKTTQQFLLLSSFLFIARSGTSQISTPFTIQNLTGGAGCGYTFTYKIFDPTNATCPTVQFGSQFLPAGTGPGSTWVITCPTCTGVEDIEIITSETGSVGINFGSGPSGGGNWGCYGPTNMTDVIPGACGGFGYTFTFLANNLAQL